MDSDIIKLLLAVFLVVLNGFFVAAEFSIVKVRYSQIQLKAAEGDSMAKQAEHIIKHLDEYLSATQLGITLASLALGWVGESAMHHVIENIFHYFRIAIEDSTITTISLVLSFLIITVMHIVFGELIPKSIAIRKSESTAMAIAMPLRVFYTIFKPFIWTMNKMSNAALRLMKIHPASDQEIHSTEELQLLVKQSADSGAIEEENYEIIKNAFDFTDHSAKQIMIPRQNISSIDIEEPVEDMISKIMEGGYSRLPVYKDSIDNIIGIFYAKEIIREYVKRKGEINHTDIKELMRDPFFVVGSKKISDLLKVFQQKKQHLAVVIDEFGGTEGIVTLEDILEELVGEIQDEEDEEERIVDKVGENVFWVKATQPLDEINENLPKMFPLSEDGEYNTLAGFILHELEDIPAENQEFNINDYHVKILKMQNKSVDLVELTYEEQSITSDMADEIGEI
ncbi:HlyC/CorC family transporter [Kaistella flava (ex Peng et al. 2021)]|uniref:HlyC/CorC family transporter n=1 Tax=Kaistella flava (ex Peng et al. 2021) TaxID=2038776 RepID=A0A7M2Y8M4_9FLAO|nr:hemolysin family protein [Kaistella flava (ex Peng et al. 2021)]QOW09995.1 HlyC/CorC family transporter [Kaistella flava (ex Peng et al. 2021)]